MTTAAGSDAPFGALEEIDAGLLRVGYKERPMDQDPGGWKTLLTRANQLVRSATHPAAGLPVEGMMASLDGATGWLNSPPLTATGLRGHVVLVNFWTYPCINWLRTLPYLRAWAHRDTDHSLVVIGAHTPENARDGRSAAPGRGRRRRHRPGTGVGRPRGVEVAADWPSLRSPENYLGYERTDNLVSPNGSSWRGATPMAPRHGWDATTGPLPATGRWSGAPSWATRPVGGSSTASPPATRTWSWPRRDRGPRCGSAWRWMGAAGRRAGHRRRRPGNGTLTDPRLYQLVRQPGPVTERTFEVTFLDPGVQAYAFTIG